jgi:hypothetical protein
MPRKLDAKLAMAKALVILAATTTFNFTYTPHTLTLRSTTYSHYYL